eukprot:356637-Chlamydomonas_euryale.AAC.3
MLCAAVWRPLWRQEGGGSASEAQAPDNRPAGVDAEGGHALNPKPYLLSERAIPIPSLTGGQGRDTSRQGGDGAQPEC